MAETDQMEFDLLQRRARAAGYYVNRHKNWDPARGTGDLYLQRAKKWRNEHEETLMSYATADEIHAALAEIERTAAA
jgi:hypothetical protein